MKTKHQSKDHFNRIIDVIDSCVTHEHIMSSLNMISNFKYRFKDIDVEPLMSRAYDKRQEIYNKTIREV
jgi:hypothetical protein